MPARPVLSAHRPLRAAACAALLCGLAVHTLAQAEVTQSPRDDDGWRLVPPAQMLEQAQRQRLESRGAPRLLPLATMSLPQSTLWFGLSAPRGNASRERGVQLELRWSIPLGRRSAD